ncbi:MAG: type III pantothenate kinase [Lachnospiraceae bacterium]|nr:type III pantothenate kinase [Lachnoclostridium sp.]MDD7522254.1 type III pantothenate kinase [Lachnoclostridium sp.]MDY2598906.1 type III pantothenate kinase [Lachnospiraceae bacterium]
MLLALDAGNTNITIGVFEGEEFKGIYRLTTKLPRTSDEFGLLIVDLIKQCGATPDDIDDVIIASVVPNIMYSLTSSIIKYFNCNPIEVKSGIKTGLKIATTNPKELGADRIVDAVAAIELYGGPIIVVDFGTATTFDLVSGDGTFVAAVTSPGIRTSAEALFKGAAKLPEVEIRKPDTILAKDTITSMQAGLFYGWLGQTEYIIKKLKEESGYTDVKVVATGGLGKLFSKESKEIEIYNPRLTLYGLKYVYERCKGK